jgi:hypothetical protein
MLNHFDADAAETSDLPGGMPGKLAPTLSEQEDLELALKLSLEAAQSPQAGVALAAETRSRSPQEVAASIAALEVRTLAFARTARRQ